MGRIPLSPDEPQHKCNSWIVVLLCVMQVLTSAINSGTFLEDLSSGSMIQCASVALHVKVVQNYDLECATASPYEDCNCLTAFWLQQMNVIDELSQGLSPRNQCHFDQLHQATERTEAQIVESRA